MCTSYIGEKEIFASLILSNLISCIIASVSSKSETSNVNKDNDERQRQFVFLEYFLWKNIVENEIKERWLL